MSRTRESLRKAGSRFHANAVIRARSTACLRAGRAAAPRTRGFSLLELMVVVAIIGIMAAIAVPNVRDVVQAREDEAALVEIKGALTRFRNLARTRVTCVEVKATPGFLVARAYLDCEAKSQPIDIDTVNTNVDGDAQTLDIPIDPKRVELVGFTAPGLVGDPMYQKRGGLKLNGPLVLTAKTKSDGKLHTFTVFPATGLVRSQ